VHTENPRHRSDPSCAPLDSQAGSRSNLAAMSDSAPSLATEPPPSRLRVCLTLAWLLLFCAVFFQLDLPNHTDSRVDVLAKLPFLFFNMVTQHPDLPETSWANLPQRFPFLLAAGVALFGAWGLGQLMLRLLRVPLAARSLERFVLGCGVGLSGLSLCVLGLGLLAQSVPGAMSRPVLLSLTILFGLAEAALVIKDRRRVSLPDSAGPLPGKETANRRKKKGDPEKGILAGGQISYRQLGRVAAGIVIVLFVVAMALGSMLPSIDFDVKEYHLGGPKEHFQNGFVSFLPHNVYTSFPFLTEMLSLLGMILCGDWYEGALAGKLILASFAPLTSLAVFAMARRWFGELAGWTAALIHISTPWTYRISIIAYAEGGLTFYLFATLFAVDLTLDSFRRSLSDNAEPDGHPGAPCPCVVVLCGFLAGSAMACKYPGVLQVVIPLGLALLWLVFQATKNTDGAARTVIKTGLLYSAGVLIAVGPWLLKNLCETGNPVYPLLQSVFHGTDWTPTLEANWKRAHSPDHHNPADFFVKLFDVTLKSDWLSPLLFSLAPLAWLSTRSRSIVRGLWLYVGFLFLSWWVFTHRIDRFWIPLIPVVAVLAGAGVAWSRDRVWRSGTLVVVSLCAVFNLGFISGEWCGLNQWLGDLRLVEQIASHASCPGIASLNRMLDSSKVKILMVGEAQIFDARFPLVYNTVFDISIFEQWCSAAEPGVPPAEQPMKPPEQIRQKLIDERVTHVYVNWQEVLRYRMTYGYSEFVAPHRLATLLEEGVFIGSPLAITGLAELSQMGQREQADIRKWAPELIVPHEGKVYFLSSQLYTVRK
jgi:4-amino-4-deoxy-L-arabinose transferase-like glycosyltransferase